MTPAESTEPAGRSEEEALDPLAVTLFGVRDRIRHHAECREKRGIHDTADECALRDIIERYAAAQVREAQAATWEAASEAQCEFEHLWAAWQADPERASRPMPKREPNPYRADSLSTDGGAS